MTFLYTLDGVGDPPTSDSTDDNTTAIVVGTLCTGVFIILCFLITFGIVLRRFHQRRYKVDTAEKQ